MPSTAEQIKSIILKRNGAHKQQIARELKMGLDYINLVCQDLKRKREITFREGFYWLATAKNNSQQKNSVSIVRGKPRTTTSCLWGKQERGRQNIFAKFIGIPQMTKSLTEILERAGYKTIESLADAPIARLMQETKLELREAAELINQARKALKKIGE